MKHTKKWNWRRFDKTLLITFVLLFFSFSAYGSVDDETCLGCHEDMASTLSFTPHRLSSQYDEAKAEISCESCHSGAATHADDPSADNIGNPSKQTGMDASGTCTACHQAHTGLDNYGYDAHNDLRLNCASCHKIHGRNKSLLLDDGAKFCLSCHKDVKADFSRRSNHPVKQGNLTCLSCHRFATLVDDNFSYGLFNVCQDCHPDKGGPYMYEHEPANAYSVEGSGCIECHEPHGSENNFLLKQPGDQICASCHMVPQHASAPPTHTFNEFGCLTCHSEPHGSFNNNLFLDPDLSTKFGIDCFQSGCHSLTE